jgi:hypothetical protein
MESLLLRAVLFMTRTLNDYNLQSHTVNIPTATVKSAINKTAIIVIVKIAAVLLRAVLFKTGTVTPKTVPTATVNILTAMVKKAVTIRIARLNDLKKIKEERTTEKAERQNKVQKLFGKDPDPPCCGGLSFFVPSGVSDGCQQGGSDNLLRTTIFQLSLVRKAKYPNQFFFFLWFTSWLGKKKKLNCQGIFKDFIFFLEKQRDFYNSCYAPGVEIWAKNTRSNKTFCVKMP